MKKYLFFLTLLGSLYLHAQTTAIPDPAFEQALINLGIDSDGTVNGQVLNSDIIDVHYLNVSDHFIYDLTGIEGFIHLDTLICNYNYITQIDLSANTQLKYLDLYQTGLQSLDVSNLSLLEVLICNNEEQYDYVCDCFNFIPFLDLSNNLNLKTLDCSGNPLTNIIFPNSDKLENLYVNRCGLQNIDITMLPGLKHVSFRENQFQQIDLSNNPEIYYLDLFHNELLDLDITNNPDLVFLDISKNNLSQIDLSQNTLLEQLYVGYAYFPPYGISEAYINDNNDIHTLDISQLTNLKTLAARKIDLQHIDLSNNVNLEVLDISNNNLNQFNITNNIHLKYLDLSNCGLSYLNFSQNTALEILLLGYESYASTLNLPNSFHDLLDVSHNTALKVLFAEDIDLEELDISQNQALNSVSISHNPITEFSIENNPMIEQVFCKMTELQSLNLKNGHNDILQDMIATYNPFLTCIQVDDLSYPDNNNQGLYGWHKDPGAVYSTDCSTQDMDEYENAGIEIYPNPAIDKMFIDNYTALEIKQIQIFDISGKIILQTEFTGDYIDIQALQKGVYVLKIQVGEQWITRKLMKE